MFQTPDVAWRLFLEGLQHNNQFFMRVAMEEMARDARRKGGK